MLVSDKEELYISFKKKVFSYISSKIRNVQIAEDLTSEVFVKIYEKIDSFDSSKASPPIDIKFTDRLAYYKAFDEYHTKHKLKAMENLIASYVCERLDRYLEILQ